MRTLARLTAVLFFLFLTGCDSNAKIVYQSAKLGIEAGYSCMEDGKTKDECIAQFNAAIIEKGLEL